MAAFVYDVVAKRRVVVAVNQAGGANHLFDQLALFVDISSLLVNADDNVPVGAVARRACENVRREKACGQKQRDKSECEMFFHTIK